MPALPGSSSPTGRCSASIASLPIRSRPAEPSADSGPRSRQTWTPITSCSASATPSDSGPVPHATRNSADHEGASMMVHRGGSEPSPRDHRGLRGAGGLDDGRELARPSRRPAGGEGPGGCGVQGGRGLRQRQGSPGLGSGADPRRQGLRDLPHGDQGGVLPGRFRGTGRLVAKDPTEAWRGPAFYTIGSASFGLQAGVDAAELLVVIRTERGLTSLLKSTATLGADATAVVGPKGGGRVPAP